jgi:hypothetical protein
MATIHDAACRAQLVQRIQSLTSGSQRRWGKMTVDQMLWHVNDAMALSLGELTVAYEKVPIPRPLLKFIVLNLPWAKSGPTHPAFIARKNYDFEAERSRCLRLIEKISSANLNSAWPEHPAFGSMTGTQVSKLHAKHLNHHLTQFGV